MASRSTKNSPKTGAVSKRPKKVPKTEQTKTKVTKPASKELERAKKPAQLRPATTEPEPIVEEAPAPVFRLLDLPESVRLKIYTWAGLIRSCPIHLNDAEKAVFKSMENSSEAEDPETDDHSGGYRRRVRHPPQRTTRCVLLRPHENWLLPGEKSCKCPQFPMQLMRVSKAIHDDVEAMFYGHNKFRVFIDLNAANKVLQSLSDLALRSIKNIDVSLGKLTNSDFRKKNGIDVALLLFLDIITQKVCSGGLRLVIGCDICGLRVRSREMFMAPFDTVHGVESCVARLEPFYRRRERLNPYFGDLAQQIVSRATSTPMTNADQVFRFAELPKELRLMVLAETGLVIKPDKKNPFDGLRIEHGLVHRKTVCCRKCIHDQTGRWYDSCYCFGQKSVASSTCVCVRYPRALFLVDKAVHEEAREVYLAKNRFIFADTLLGTIAYWRKCPKDVPNGMRHIDIKPMGEWRAMNRLDDVLIAHWMALAKYLQQNTLLARLELSVDFGEKIYHRCSEEKLINMPAATSIDHWTLYEQYNRMKLYKAVKEASGALEGLRSFKVFLPCDCLSEKVLEKAVMGEDYDSTKFGKIPRSLRTATSPHHRISSVVAAAREGCGR